MNNVRKNPLHSLPQHQLSQIETIKFVMFSMMNSFFFFFVAITTIFFLNFIAICHAIPDTSAAEPAIQLLGVVAKFDVSNCGDDIKNGLKPTALQYIDGKPIQYKPISTISSDTIFVPDGFNGTFYLDDGKQAPEVSSIHLSTVIKNSTLQAFYKIKDDDQPYKPGKDNHLPVLAPLKNILFSDTDPNAPPINDQSTAYDVRQSTKIHNTLSIIYCP